MGMGGTKQNADGVEVPETFIHIKDAVDKGKLLENVC